MALIVYGIKNCNTVKTAVTWLKEHDVEFEFHDYKVKGIAEKKLKEWTAQVGWESLVNRKGTTWRQLDPAVQAKIKSESAALKLMMEKTSVIKRPVVESGNKIVTLGFDADAYAKAFT